MEKKQFSQNWLEARGKQESEALIAFPLPYVEGGHEHGNAYNMFMFLASSPIPCQREDDAFLPPGSYQSFWSSFNFIRLAPRLVATKYTHSERKVAGFEQTVWEEGKVVICLKLSSIHSKWQLGSLWLWLSPVPECSHRQSEEAGY